MKHITKNKYGLSINDLLSFTLGLLRLLNNFNFVNFMAPFYGWGSTASRLRSHYEEVIHVLPHFFPEIPGTHLINLRKMKG